MKWITLSDKFPDDWESKILRTVTTRIVLTNDEWRHVNDHFWHSEKRIDFDYAEIEWLDESEPDQDELWEDVVSIYNEHLNGGSRDSLILELRNIYTLIHK